MDGHNINAPCLFPMRFLYGFSACLAETPSAGVRLPDTILSGIRNPLAGCNCDPRCQTNGYCDREHWNHDVLRSEESPVENNSLI